MAGKSKIEWTTDTWNPVTGCTEVSPGCDHCYAKTFAERWRGIEGHPYEQGFDLRLWEERLEVPLRWKKSRRIFVNSMSDLFHKDVPTDFIKRVFEVMNRASHHQFQVLTKRPQRMARLVGEVEWTPNIWQGVSIESNEYVWRADWLRKVPAAVRFISAEPLLGGLPDLSLDGIHWLIAGGESGHGARPMHPEWAGDLQERCATAGVAFFFKQWGEHLPIATPRLAYKGAWTIVAKDGQTRTTHDWQEVVSVGGSEWAFERVGKKYSGRILKQREWNEYPVAQEVEA